MTSDVRNIDIDERIAGVARLELQRRANPSLSLSSSHVGSGFVRTRLRFLKDYQFANNTAAFAQASHFFPLVVLSKPITSYVRAWSAIGSFFASASSPTIIMTPALASDPSTPTDVGAASSVSITGGQGRADFNEQQMLFTGPISWSTLLLNFSAFPFATGGTIGVTAGTTVQIVWKPLSI